VYFSHSLMQITPSLSLVEQHYLLRRFLSLSKK